MSSEAQIFLGFATLEEWAQAVDRKRPVLAMPLVHPGPNSGGMQVDELRVVCQQVTDSGTVLYCRLRAASLTRFNGQPFDSDWKEREEAWDSLWEAVEAYLKEQGFTLRRATVAHPKDHVFLEGKAGFIRFDKEAKRYRRVNTS